MLDRWVRTWLLAAAISTAPLGAGCAGSTPAVAMVKVEGEVASLSYALRLSPGQGTMTKMTGDAARNALIAAGFRLGEESDADVILELELTDFEMKSFIVMTVNGKQQTKRGVTAVMRAVSADGKTLDQHVEKFTVTQDEEVDEKKLAALTNHFAKSAELERYSLERQIERVKGGGSPDAASDLDEAPKGKDKSKEKSKSDATSSSEDDQAPSNDAAPAVAPGPNGSGRLPREAIQKTVRSHMPRLRLCYESALKSKPTLKGTVEVAFVITLEGAVAAVSSGLKTDMPDAAVVTCVTKAFQRMEFPMPEGGDVKVSYPIAFKP